MVGLARSPRGTRIKISHTKAQSPGDKKTKQGRAIEPFSDPQMTQIAQIFNATSRSSPSAKICAICG